MMDGPELMTRVETLGARVDDPAARQLVAAVMELYGEGLRRIVALADPAALAALAADDVVAALLLIHDLHPVALEERVRRALERVRPYMASHGGDVELLGCDDGVARLRLVGSCNSCSASSSTLELAVEQALEELAPDLAGLEVEGLPEAPAVSGVALPMAGAGAGAALPMAPSWFDADVRVASLALDTLAATRVGGRELVIANVDGTLLAYADACASCGSALHGGRLTAGALACPACGRTFLLPRAGRSADDERLQLEPVPLLREDGRVRVALAG